MSDTIRNIGIFISYSTDNSYAESIRSLFAALKAADMYGFLFHFFSDFTDYTPSDRGELAILSHVPYTKLDAVVIFSDSIKQQNIISTISENAAKHSVPVITIGAACDGCFQIELTSDQAFRTLVRHVLDVHHCTRTAMIAGIRDNEYSDRRIQIYREELEKSGLPYSERLVKYGDFWYYPTQTALSELLAENPADTFPQAIICANDTMAMTVCDELRKVGKRVPEDVIVTGFDGIYTEQYFRPRLSTVAMDCDAVSAAVVSLLLEIQQDKSQPPRRVPVPYIMRQGKSCGCGIQQSESEVDTGKSMLNLYLSLEGYSKFSRIIHDFTARLLGDYPPEELPQRMLDSAFGLAWYRCELILTRETVEKLGFSLTKEQQNHEMIEFCCWRGNEKIPLMQPFTSDFLVSDINATIGDAFSNAVMVTALHEQEHFFGYYVITFDPPSPDFSDVRLDYDRLLNYQSQIAHILATLISHRSLININQQLQQLYLSDSMTGMLNRRGFFSKLHEAIKAQQHDDFFLCIVAADMDGLKFINDNFGHGEGDIAILALTNALRQSLPAESICARFGGDEFIAAVLFPQFDAEFESKFRIRLEDALSAVNDALGKPYRIAASIGIEMQSYSENMDIDAAMKSADNKLYLDKARRKCVRDTRRNTEGLKKI